MTKNLLSAIFVLLAGFMAISAQENTVETQRGEMKKVESLIGEWKGSGWIQQGDKRETFTGTENVQRKVDGLALLIEGKFANAEGKIIHNTLAVLSYDAKNSKYSFRTYLSTGRSGEFDFKIVSDSYEWGFQMQAMTIRYTINTANNTWLEVGEVSKDGKTWMKFLEMKLEKVK